VGLGVVVVGSVVVGHASGYATQQSSLSKKRKVEGISDGGTS